MPNVEELLRPYVESSTIEEAERALDRLADEEAAAPQVLGEIELQLHTLETDAGRPVAGIPSSAPAARHRSWLNWPPS